MTLEQQSLIALDYVKSLHEAMRGEPFSHYLIEEVVTKDDATYLNVGFTVPKEAASAQLGEGSWARSRPVPQRSYKIVVVDADGFVHKMMRRDVEQPYPA